MSKIDAARFVLQCKNWYEVALPIATHQAPTRVILKNGARFDSHALYWADMHAIFFQDIYTPRYLPVGRHDLVVDIGANIGVFSIFAARQTSNKVYAIEPSPRNFLAINKNIRANNLTNVTPLHFAISDQDGTETFFDTGASQHHRLHKLLDAPVEQCIQVPSMTLQSFMDTQQIAQIDFLKLDCEGAEEAIIVHTPPTYLQRVRKIALEFHDHLTERNHQELRRHLEQLGYHTKIFWDGKSVLGFIYAWRD